MITCTCAHSYIVVFIIAFTTGKAEDMPITMCSSFLSTAVTPLWSQNLNYFSCLRPLNSHGLTIKLAVLGLFL